MVNVQLTISVDKADLQNLRARVADMSPAMARIGAYLMQKGDINFMVGGRIEKWLPLAQSTLEQKERLGYTRAPLVRTGMLRGSGQITDLTPSSVTFEYMDWKAPFHDKPEGDTGNMPPQRKLIQINDDDVEMIKTIIEEWITDGSI